MGIPFDERQVVAMKRVAIIGAGISGLACALHLNPDIFDITIFDKSRSKGGRISTKRVEDYHFDHGVQYISPTDSPFKLELEQWQSEGVIKEWKGVLGEMVGSKIEPTVVSPVYVGSPKMSQIGQHLMEGLDHAKFVFSTRIASVFKKFNEWYLMDDADEIFGGFDFIIVTIPAPQASDLLKDYGYLTEILSQVETSPRWALLVGLKHKLQVQYDGVFVNDSPIRWMARNNSKPDRPNMESWVVHASREWSARNVNEDREWVNTKLFEEFLKITGFEEIETEFKQVHLWRYAIVDRPLNQNFILDNNRNIGLTGDYCMGNNIEAAYLSGESLGQRLNTMKI
ncbi:MAG: NAD(P)/FAD-dependent oxidoreductase [Candidatus Kariarchaeaceae archaeon]